jgi:hypothetical protein
MDWAWKSTNDNKLCITLTNCNRTENQHVFPQWNRLDKSNQRSKKNEYRTWREVLFVQITVSGTNATTYMETWVPAALFPPDLAPYSDLSFELNLLFNFDSKNIQVLIVSRRSCWTDLHSSIELNLKREEKRGWWKRGDG